MHNTKERLSLLWIFALLNYLYADVVALFAIAGTGNSFEPLSPLALLGRAVLIGNTRRHNSGVSAASISSQPAGEYRRGCHFDTYKRFPHLRAAPGRVGQAARLSRVRFLRHHRNDGHLGHHLAGVDLGRGGAGS